MHKKMRTADGKNVGTPSSQQKIHLSLTPNASDQENKPEVTTRDKNIWNAPDQSEGRNGKNSLGEPSIIEYELSRLFFQLRLRLFYTQLRRSFCVDSQLRG